MAKTLRFGTFAVLLVMTLGMMMTSCSKDDDPTEKEQLIPNPDEDTGNDEPQEDDGHGDDDPQPEEPDLETVARITETVRYEQAKATVYNIEYPSTDPFGQPVTLSGSIILGDEVMADHHARGAVLYNHYTVYQKDQCPSHGELDILLKVVGSKLFAVAADYYGFGATEDKNQAYCIASVNAQASIDALLAARQLLAEQGFTWDDYLFNLGYSEGGQTSMGVLKLVAEKYPDIHITHTIAGGGPYDITETYRQLVSAGETSMPSTVISVLLAYNEYFQIGIPNSDMFMEPTLSRIDTYLLSKQYKRAEMEGVLAPYKIADWINPVLFNYDSDISRSLMKVFEQENLSKNWIPRGDERINIIHNKLDACVPYTNSTQMIDFLTQKGFSVSHYPAPRTYQDGSVYVTMGDWKPLSPALGAHEFGAIFFITDLIQVICHYLDIQPWFTIEPSELENL